MTTARLNEKTILQKIPNTVRKKMCAVNRRSHKPPCLKVSTTV